MNIQDLIQKRNNLEAQLDNVPSNDFAEQDRVNNRIFDLNHKIRLHPDYKTTVEHQQEINVQTNGHIW